MKLSEREILDLAHCILEYLEYTEGRSVRSGAIADEDWIAENWFSDHFQQVPLGDERELARYLSDWLEARVPA